MKLCKNCGSEIEDSEGQGKGHRKYCLPCSNMIHAKQCRNGSDGGRDGDWFTLWKEEGLCLQISKGRKY